MARMFPERLPEGLASDAEYDLFAAFQRELDEHFTVFASVKWLMHGGRGGAREGEADFIIANPERGLLVIEAKGGQISVDGASGQWFSIDRYGHKHEIKNPVDQAQRNVHTLDQKLHEAPATARHHYAIGHAVALPDARLKQTALGPACPPEIIIDADAYGSMQQTIDRLYTFTLGDRQRSFGSTGLRALIDVISPSWEIQVALLAQLRSEQEKFRTLTEQQFIVLDFLAGHRRALIDGCAGSGKTFLAMEKARRLAEEGFETLLTCFNRNLAEWIRSRLDPLPATLRVQHFHELAHDLVNEAGAGTTVPDSDRSTYFKTTLPTTLLDVHDLIKTRFDAIVVDEGQDFEDTWWVPLMALMRSPESVFFVFYDSQQAIYTDGPSLPFESQPHFLSRNMRNTQEIHRLIAPYYGERLVDCHGPAGRPPVQLKVDDPSDALRKQLHRLINTEGISHEDIVVLTPASRGRSRWSEQQRLGNVTLTWSLTPRAGEVSVATIHSFKGLERPVVIVTERELHSAGQRQERLEMVAFSRASSELIIFSQA